MQIKICNNSEIGLHGPIQIRKPIHFDKRGFFNELFHKENYNGIIPEHNWVQINHSFSVKNVIRGLHFQGNEAKLVNVIYGEIFDVIVDVRPNSKHFGHWEGFHLNNITQLYIPPGFAHGFLVKTSEAHVVYNTSENWNPDKAQAIKWNDPDLNIKWNIKTPIISEKDSNNQSFQDYRKSIGIC